MWFEEESLCTTATAGKKKNRTVKFSNPKMSRIPMSVTPPSRCIASLYECPLGAKSRLACPTIQLKSLP
jgi:hypothetical protein